jgi:hypothetical protein
VKTLKIAPFSLIILLFASQVLPGKTVSYGTDHGWGDTITENLRETDGWRGKPALTLAPLGRNPFLSEATGFEGETKPGEIDLLLLAEQQGIENPAGRYRIAGTYEISSLFPARGETSIRPGPGGIKLYPSPAAMWAPGREWGNFTLDFRLRPATLREGEIFFSWQGRTADGGLQSVTAKVEKRRLVWFFKGFFRHDTDQSLNLALTSPPLIPGEWGHHRIRFMRNAASPGRAGASPGLLEYLVDGIPSTMVHTTPDGREGSEPYAPKIGRLSDGPLLIAPEFNGYIDEFRLVSSFDSTAPAGGYSNVETSVSGRGSINPVDSGYPASSLTGVRIRVEVPGDSRVRFYARAIEKVEDIGGSGLPVPGDPAWKMLNMVKEPEDPTGFGRWYSWDRKFSLRGRYFMVGYILDPDPGADLAPVLSALDISVEPRLPPRPPRELKWERGEDSRIRISWSGDAETEVAGWWLYWGPRPGDYSSTEIGDTVRGTVWIPRTSGTSGARPEYVWPDNNGKHIIYTTVRAAWREGAPNENTDGPGDYRALSEPAREMNFRP